MLDLVEANGDVTADAGSQVDLSIEVELDSEEKGRVLLLALGVGRTLEERAWLTRQMLFYKRECFNIRETSWIDEDEGVGLSRTSGLGQVRQRLLSGGTDVGREGLGAATTASLNIRVGGVVVPVDGLGGANYGVSGRGEVKRRSPYGLVVAILKWDWMKLRSFVGDC